MTGSTDKDRRHPKEISRAIGNERLSLRSQNAEFLKKRWIKGDLLFKYSFHDNKTVFSLIPVQFT